MNLTIILILLLILVFLFLRGRHSSKFILKIVPAWFSEDYVSFKYSRNGGITWSYIHTASRSTLDGWEYKRLTYRLRNGNFDEEKRKFSSYTAVKEYEDEQYAIYLKGCDQERREAQERKERIKSAYKKANS